MRTAPWTKALYSLIGRPRVSGPIALAGIGIGFIAAAPILFVETTSSAMIDRQIAESCPGVGVDPALGYNYDIRLDRLATPSVLGAAHDSPWLGDPILTLVSFGQGFESPGSTDQPGAALILHRTGYEKHLQPLAGGGRGVWVPETLAQQLHLTVGSELVLGEGGPTRTVQAIYRDLSLGALDEWSCSLSEPLYLRASSGPEVPPAVIVPFEDFDAVVDLDGDRSGDETGRFGPRWGRVEWPLEPMPTTLSEAHDSLTVMNELRVELSENAADVYELRAPDPVVASRLGFMARRAEAVRSAVSTALIPVTATSFAALVALAGSLGVFWLDKRRRDSRLLLVRGVPPWLIGVRGLVEMLLPTVSGAVIGWMLAIALLPRVGPSSHIDPQVRLQSALWMLVTFVVVMLALTVCISWRARRLLGDQPSRVRARIFTKWVGVWEAPVLGLATWSYLRLRGSPAPIARGDLAPDVDRFALLFPLLFLAGMLGLTTRLLRASLGESLRRNVHLPLTWFLAIRRLGSERLTTGLLVGVSAFAAAVFTYGAGLVRSADETARAKSGAEAGAELTSRVVIRGETPPLLPGRSTVVWFTDKGRFAGVRVELLAVDPATFVDGAYWHRSFADRSLHELLAELSAPLSSGHIPVLAVGEVPREGSFERQGNLHSERPFKVVDHVALFPSADRALPTIIVAQSMINPSLARGFGHELWARDTDATELRRAASNAGLTLGPLVERTQLEDSSTYLPTLWTFSYVQGVGVAIGLFAAVGLIIYADSRERVRARAAILLARMRVGSGQRWRALVAELALISSFALLAGIGLGWGAVLLVNPHLDAAPSLPPAQLLAFPYVHILMLIGGYCLLVFLASAVTAYASSRTDAAALLRESL